MVLHELAFQFTPLREGRHRKKMRKRALHDFNSRPSARGDKSPGRTPGGSHISIHAPPRGATRTPRPSPTPFPLFQFTPLREGRRIRAKRSPQAAYFNSRPSARGDATFPVLSRCIVISIHAPPRGATKPDPPQSGGSPISIHAPPRGATTAKPQGLGAFQFQFTPLREGRRVSFASRKPVSPNFNSRPSARGDPIPAHGDSTFPFQFTPLREGRRVTRSPTPQAANFNSRPSARGDGASSSSTGGAALFQFTPLREGRPEMPDYWLRAPGYFNSRPSARGDLMARSKTKKISHFNSRPSARGDVRAASRGRGLCISIHAPPRGATGVSASRSSVSLRISIHAPPRGATARQNVGDCIRVFQFTPLREGRLSQKSITPVGDYFNSRPSARGDSGQRPPSLLNPHFNSRPSARGDFSR